MAEADEKLEVEKTEIGENDPVVVTIPDSGEPVVELAKEPEIEKKDDDVKIVKVAAHEREVRKKEKAEPKEEEKEEIPGIKALQAQLDTARRAAEDERTRRVEAEKQASEHRKEVSKFKNNAERSEYDMVVNAIQGVESEAQLATRAQQEAMASGDWDAASKAQRLISRAEAKLLQLEEGKAAMEARLEAAKEEPPEVQRVDPFDQYVGQFSKPTQDWLRDHPDCVRDTATNAETIAAHHRAVKAGMTIDTPDYFGFIEEQLGLREKPEAPEVERSNGKEPAKKSYSAPPSREAPSSSGGKSPSSRSITLTADQRSAARASGISDQDYARNLLALMDDGTISRPN